VTGHCQHENREGRRFCAECAAPLPVPCQSCGFSNEPGEKLCGGCAAPPWPWPVSSACVLSSPTATWGSAIRIAERGDPVKAKEHLAIARAMYREMGMSFWLEKAEAALGPPQGKSP
jgi:hypothetical protein